MSVIQKKELRSFAAQKMTTEEDRSEGEEVESLSEESSSSSQNIPLFWVCGSNATKRKKRSYLDDAGTGECIDMEETRVHLAAVVECSPSQLMSPVSTQRYRGESVDTERTSLGSPTTVAVAPSRRKKDDIIHILKMWLVDAMTGLVAFVITAVTYISTAHSVVGSFDPSLVYVVVDACLLGTALSGAWLSRQSRVPWAMSSVDVGFAPMLAQLGAVCWEGTVPINPRTHVAWSWSTDGDDVYSKVSAYDRRRYVATYCAASALMFATLGVVLAATGKLKLSRVVEYLPTPVTAGMLASIRVSLVKSGIRVGAFGGWRVNKVLGLSWFFSALSCAIISRLLKKYPQTYPTFLAQPTVVILATFLARIIATSLDLSRSDQERLGLLFDWDPQMLKTARGWFAWTDLGTVAYTSEKAGAERKSINVEPLLSHFIWHILLRQGDSDAVDSPAAEEHHYHSWARFLKVRFWRRGVKRFLRNVDWAVVFECRSIVTCAVIVMAMKIAMKTGSFAALFPISDIKVDEELQRLGLGGNLMPAAFLSCGQAYSFSSLRIAQQFGASETGAGVTLAILSFFAWLAGFGVLGVVPRFVYGALLMDLGYDYLETYLVTPFSKTFYGTSRAIHPSKKELKFTNEPRFESLQQHHNQEDDYYSQEGIIEKQQQNVSSSRGRSVADIATILAIVFVALVWSLLEAVSVGVILCLFFTATRLAAVSVIASNETVATARSTIERSARQNSVLDKEGDSVAVIGVRGLLFFGSATELLDVIRRLPPQTKHLVLDVGQCVQTYDATAVAAFDQIIEIGKHRGFTVSIAPEPPALVDRLAGKRCLFFQDPDDAIEHAEDALLTTLLPPTPLVARSTRKKTTCVVPIFPQKDQRRFDLSPPPPPPPLLSPSPGPFFAALPSVDRLLRSWLKAAADDGIGNTIDDLVASALLTTKALRAFHCHAQEHIYHRGQRVTNPAFVLICAGRFRLLAQGDRCVRKLTPGHAIGVGAYYFHHFRRDDDSGGEDILSPPVLAPIRSHTLQSSVAHGIILEVPYSAIARVEQDNLIAALEFHKLMARTLSIKNRNSLLSRRGLTNNTDDTPVLHHPRQPPYS